MKAIYLTHQPDKKGKKKSKTWDYNQCFEQREHQNNENSCWAAKELETNYHPMEKK